MVNKDNNSNNENKYNFNENINNNNGDDKEEDYKRNMYTLGKMRTKIWKKIKTSILMIIKQRFRRIFDL